MSVVTRMIAEHRRAEFERLHPEWVEAERKRFAEIEASRIDPLELPVLQQAALLSMHESQARRTVTARLLEDSQDKPCLDDFRALCEAGLTVRNHGKRFHELTPQGRSAARLLEQKLAERFDIHLLTYGDSRNAGPLLQIRCPCGWTHRVVNDGRSISRAALAFHEHLKQIERLRSLTGGVLQSMAEAE